ncbi:MAG TPA: PilN domain-containing protein [Gammaproteobacteria bacterium]|nr:PilN domain-containing protein [Gammaproteobacteria bacterium]
MPRINLLPWREELRQKRKKDFMVALLAALIFGGLAVYGSKLTVQHWIGNQNARNKVLKDEIAKLDKQIEEISGLETQKNRLIARMEIIDQLQRSRPEIVHLFDELVNTLPDGVYLTEVKQTGTRLEIHGQAQSSTRVSALMRNIDSSDWLKNPSLGVVETTSDAAHYSKFTVFAQQVPMAEQGEGADTKVAAKAPAKPSAKRGKAKAGAKVARASK